jgi:hypothetical protein
MPPARPALAAAQHVDAVAIDGAVGLLDHITQVNADPKAHAPVFR